jgi:D-alanine--poly(phosphoribitol) ligase subunit 1
MLLIEKKLKQFSKKFANYIAIETCDFIITYKELYLYVSYLTKVLSSSKEKNIIIYGEKKSLCIIAILACLFSGITYIPVSKSTPLYRLKKIIKKTKSNIIINCSKIKINLKIKKINIHDLSFFKKEFISSTNFKKILKNNIAYIIFTSGSTGEPKGVCISYKSLEHYVVWLNKNFFIGPKNSCLQYADIGFDLSVADIYGTLTSAGRLYVAESEYEKIFPAKIINEKKINNLVIVPSIIDLISNSDELKLLSNVKRIFFCGEPLTKNHMKKVFKFNSHVVVLNAYGPTEFTCSCSCIELNNNNYNQYSDASMSFGKPNKGIFFKLIDSYKKDIGELVISGKQMFENYLEQKELSKQKLLIINKKKYYKTGDIVRYYKKNYYFIKRKDNQVKIKGMRIELTEIDFHLKKLGCEFSYSFIKDKKIYSLIKSKYNYVTFKNKLSKIIPNYMIPDKIIKLKKIIYNQNNKIDYNKLKNSIY